MNGHVTSLPPTQEKLALAKDKEDLEECRSSVLCVNCRTPVREGASQQLAVGAPLQQGVGVMFPASTGEQVITGHSLAGH